MSKNERLARIEQRRALLRRCYTNLLQYDTTQAMADEQNRRFSSLCSLSSGEVVLCQGAEYFRIIAKLFNEVQELLAFGKQVLPGFEIIQCYAMRHGEDTRMS